MIDFGDGRAERWDAYEFGELIKEAIQRKAEQLRVAGYRRVGLENRWMSPGSEPFHPTLTLNQAHRQMVANEKTEKESTE